VQLLNITHTNNEVIEGGGGACSTYLCKNNVFADVMKAHRRSGVVVPIQGVGGENKGNKQLGRSKRRREENIE